MRVWGPVSAVRSGAALQSSVLRSVLYGVLSVRTLSRRSVGHGVRHVWLCRTLRRDILPGSPSVSLSYCGTVSKRLKSSPKFTAIWDSVVVIVTKTGRTIEGYGQFRATAKDVSR